MAGITGCRGLDMFTGLACSRHPVMAAFTGPTHTRMDENECLPGSLRGLAGVTGRIGLDMAVVFTGSSHPIMAARARARHPAVIE